MERSDFFSPQRSQRTQRKCKSLLTNSFCFLLNSSSLWPLCPLWLKAFIPRPALGKTILSTLLCLMTAPSIKASMTVDKMVLYFNPGELPRQDVTITNPDDEILYLETEILKVENPGTPDEKDVKIDNPDQMKLLVTPQKAVLPSNTFQVLRLINLEPPKDVEQVYRVTFRPVVGEVKASSTAIKILIAYQALVFVRPEKPAFHLEPRQTGAKLTLTNTGNIHTQLRNSRFCTPSAKGKQDCTETTLSGRIYPGQSKELTLPLRAIKSGGTLHYGCFDGSIETPTQIDIPAWHTQPVAGKKNHPSTGPNGNG